MPKNFSFYNPERHQRIVRLLETGGCRGIIAATSRNPGMVGGLYPFPYIEDGDFNVPSVFLNGEDYYSNPGQMLYLKENRDSFSEILLGVNIDGPGYREGDTAFSLYDCPPVLAGLVREALAARGGMVEGEPWFQGDHGLFLMNKRPALALTSERLDQVLKIAHTPGDHRGEVAAGKLVDAARALQRLVRVLDSR